MNNAKATEKQDAFITSLLETRTVDTELYTMVQVVRETQGAYTVTVASELISQLLKCRPVAKPQVAVAPVAALTDGMYRDPQSGRIFKIQFNRAQGDGRRMYAKELVQEGEEWSFVYAAGAMRTIRPEWRMTLEQAKEFGALYGTCCVCGRTLTNEISIEAGIGPICAGRI